MSRELYDLTHPQKRIFQLEQLYSNKGALNIMGYIIFKNKLEKERRDT